MLTKVYISVVVFALTIGWFVSSEPEEERPPVRAQLHEAKIEQSKAEDDIIIINQYYPEFIVLGEYINLQGIMMKPQGIIIHCSESPHGRGDDAETIHKWHLDRGWDGIGYHYVITESGEIQRGRPTYWIGSHARGHNEDIGICLIGIDEFTYEQFESLANLVKATMAEFNIDAQHVIGHCDVSEKSCPRFDVGAFKNQWHIA